MLLASSALIVAALAFNKTLARQVELKTRELLDSQERLMHSERFAAVGEAAAYVTHEIKNPLMVIGGLAGQVERRLAEDSAAQEKLHIIQGRSETPGVLPGRIAGFPAAGPSQQAGSRPECDHSGS